jgi:hypothetical protein
MSAIFDLETAINKNLDPKLHIVIADDGIISMANGNKDPWSTQYHGQYITNASADAAAKWNTDASMTASTGDNMDRGAILMYSNGANQKFGTMVKIEKGVVTTAASQIDAEHPDNNTKGADDYVLAVVYSYSNGYGETGTTTKGFSTNQQFLTGNGGNLDNLVSGGNAGSGTPTMLNGLGQEANNIDNYNTLTFRASMDINDFNKVEVDNNLVDPSNYTTKSGSTIVTLKSNFIKTLSEGTHTISIFNKNNEFASCEFVIYGCNHEFEMDEWDDPVSCTCLKCNKSTSKVEHTLDNNGVCAGCDLPITPTPGVSYVVSQDGTYVSVVDYVGASKKFWLPINIMGCQSKR